MPVPKIHLLLRGDALCDYSVHERGPLAVTTASIFRRLTEDERCAECARKLEQLPIAHASAA